MQSTAIMPHWRQKLKIFFNHSYVHAALGAIILMNIVTLGLEVSKSLSPESHDIIIMFNNMVLVLFAIEIAVKIIAEGTRFFRDGWHVFDFIVIGLALLSFGGVIQVFRALRILWLLRLLTFAPHFKRLINSILQAIPNVMVVAFLLLLAVYISALVGTVEFGSTNPEFDGVATSMETLAKTVLMEHTWSERYEALLEHYPNAWAFIFPVMIILNYLLLHLVVGVLVTALNKQYEEDEKSQKHAFLQKFLQKTHKGEENPFSAETKAILQSLEEMKSLMKK